MFFLVFCNNEKLAIGTMVDGMSARIFLDARIQGNSHAHNIRCRQASFSFMRFLMFLFKYPLRRLCSAPLCSADKDKKLFYPPYINETSVPEPVCTEIVEREGFLFFAGMRS